ncbi:GAF domain-containing protein [Flavobacteriaceae bacterium]|nr:GAF domain-containing protein [Flavobacteriaceae bacterium]
MILDTLKPQLTAIIEDKTATVDQRLQNICKLLTQQVSYYDWVGFYFANHATKTLHLKAYCGAPTEHTVIEFGKGICGQVAVSNKNFVVPDVKAQDNYIACSISVKAEIVIPLFKNGTNIGQIDIDSNTQDPFTKIDEDFLTWLNEKVATIL